MARRNIQTGCKISPNIKYISHSLGAESEIKIGQGGCPWDFSMFWGVRASKLTLPSRVDVIGYAEFSETRMKFASCDVIQYFPSLSSDGSD